MVKAEWYWAHGTTEPKTQWSRYWAPLDQNGEVYSEDHQHQYFERVTKTDRSEHHDFACAVCGDVDIARSWGIVESTAAAQKGREMLGRTVHQGTRYERG